MKFTIITNINSINGKIMERILFSPEFKLKLKAKKLESRKLQVKFFSTFLNQKAVYGYILVESKTTLKDVVEGICLKLNQIQQDQDYYHSHLYSVGKESKDNFHFRIFNSLFDKGNNTIYYFYAIGPGIL